MGLDGAGQTPRTAGTLAGLVSKPTRRLVFCGMGSVRQQSRRLRRKFTTNLDIEAIPDPFSVKKVAKFQPAQTSARMAAQATMMTIHPNQKIAYTSKTLHCFQISSKLAPTLKDHLRRCGMHPATVFPDLDGLAKSIRYSY